VRRGIAALEILVFLFLFPILRCGTARAVTAILFSQKKRKYQSGDASPHSKSAITSAALFVSAYNIGSEGEVAHDG
jgi:hypothetical protein